jgi:hypothetical protein
MSCSKFVLEISLATLQLVTETVSANLTTLPVIAQIWKKEDYFPTTDFQGQSESVVRFSETGRFGAGKSFFKLCHIHFQFRWHQLWMAPSGKLAPLPGDFSGHPAT